MKEVSLLENLRLNKFYKYLLYLAGVILVTSMFVESGNINIRPVRRFCLHTIILGSVLWILDGIIGNILDYWSILEEEGEIRKRRAKELFRTGTFFYYLIMIVALIIWVIMIPFSSF